MLSELDVTLHRKCGIKADQLLLVGVSGGPDSLCLAHALHALGSPMVIAHLNHALRPEADEEAQLVADFADRLGVPFHLERADVRAFAENQRLSLEEAARLQRYEFLFRQAGRCGAQAVVTAHNADDQVETVLMHLLRGAGLAGLGGMAFRSLPNSWSAEIPLVRPLLGVWRTQVLEYIKQHSLVPNLDASNLDVRFFRNRLRHELIPYLETYQPNLGKRLWQTADILREDYRSLGQLIDQGWDDFRVREGSGWLQIDPTRLAAWPLGVQRHVLRRAFGQLHPGLRDIDYAVVDRALQALEEPRRYGRIDLAAGLALVFEPGRVFLVKGGEPLPAGEWPQMALASHLRLEIPGEVDLSAGWRLSAEIVVLENEAQRLAIRSNADPYLAWLDLAVVDLPLVLRPRRPGDRFQPLGMASGSIKVSDYMINCKLPQRARAAWPLVCTGETIAWVPGGGPGEIFRVQGNTCKAICLALQWMPSGE